MSGAPVPTGSPGGDRPVFAAEDCRRTRRHRRARRLASAGAAAVAAVLLAGPAPAQHAGHSPPADTLSEREGPVPAPGTLSGPRPRTWTVDPDGAIPEISAAVDSARPGDTVRVLAGRYRERVLVGVPLVLIGEGRPVIDAGGEGHAVEATAPLEIRGFEIRGTGTNPDEEPAGIMVRDARVRVVDNVLEDVYYGVYLKNSQESVVRGNRITGKPLAPPRRGDGIRLWYSSGTEIVDNTVIRARDVVVFFSDRLSIRENLIRGGRYGLHYMYSDHNRFERNRFVGNQVGSFIMYSTDIALVDNLFAESRGASAMGLGLKDADDISATGNLFVENGAGVYLDNSPRGRDARNHFERNLFFENEAALRILPSVTGNVFRDNAFVSNGRPVDVTGDVGEGQAAQNDWRGNHWSGYAGFDRDGDRVGDTPYVYARLSENLMTENPSLRLFTYSPAVEVAEAASEFFPFLKPRPVVIDSFPKLARDAYRRWETSPPVASPPSLRPERSSGRRAGAAGLLLAGVLAGAGAAVRTLGRRP